MNLSLDEKNKLSAKTYKFEQVNIGDWYETDKLEVTTQHIDGFAKLSGDEFEIHMNAQAAKDAGFNDRVAHGILIMGLADGLKNQAQTRFEAIATRAWSWDFQGPVECGDTIYARIQITNKKKTSKKGKGVLELEFAIINQHQTIVQKGINTLLVKCESNQ